MFMANTRMGATMKALRKYWAAIALLVAIPVIAWASDAAVSYTGGNVTIQSSSTDGKNVTLATIGDGNIDLFTDSAQRWRIEGADGDLVPITDNAVDIGSSTVELADIYVDGVAYLDGIRADVTVLPGADNTVDLGSAAAEWKDLYVDGTAYIDTLSVDSIVDTVTVYVPAGIGRAGTTAGWTNTGTDINEALLPAESTASTFTIPLTGLQVGDTVTAFKVIGQIESAGGAATLDADLRKLTNAAGDPTDASIGTITQVAVTADTAVASEKTLAAAEVLASGESLYLLVTGTTAASTDARLLGVELTVTRG